MLPDVRFIFRVIVIFNDRIVFFKCNNLVTNLIYIKTDSKNFQGTIFKLSTISNGV